jgi:transcriptional repressor NrdR
MICPYCRAPESHVLRIIQVDARLATIRRRECLYCYKRYTTCETIVPSKENKNAKQLTSKSA